MSEEIKTGTALGLDQGFPFMTLLVEKLERIARAQEALLRLAQNAQQERVKLAENLTAAMKRPLEGK